MLNITQLMKKFRNMTTMNRGIITSGLDQVLNGKGPYTLFAPSDNAFTKLQPGTLEYLLMPENKTELATLINQHVVAGKISYKEFKDGDTLNSLAGKRLTVKITNNIVSIDGASIQNRGVSTSNGVIHSLDTVLKA